MERIRLAKEARAGNSDEFFFQNSNESLSCFSCPRRLNSIYFAYCFLAVSGLSDREFSLEILLYFCSKRGTLDGGVVCVMEAASRSVVTLASSSSELGRVSSDEIEVDLQGEASATRLFFQLLL